MSDGSTIEWLNLPGHKPASWNPSRGCSSTLPAGCSTGGNGTSFRTIAMLERPPQPRRSPGRTVNQTTYGEINSQ